ncbi:acyl carrier protein [Salinihabitans flavidus]|uniref:Acyl carrier protein n=1 Tax=Salinihabitans flavidus TaxID=569882 RepID=A0A1H8S0F7_9RHOB|nr:phosphopantetheine-binding protein [Salinihabitans flavidus]SEO72150.1 acyl carrier protein [Salinihabitans flavidus]
MIEMNAERSKLQEELLDLVAKEGMVEPSDISPDKRLEDLDIQSADFIMILMAIEENYGAYISVDNDLADMQTVQDLLDLAVAKIEESRKEAQA